jgi:DNA-binding NarL/FixJ family response regulator
MLREQKASNKRAKIVIVDDHPIVRQGISQLVNQESDLEICCQAGDMDSALAVMGACHHALAIVDISLAGVSGIELIKALHIKYPELPVLVMSMHDESLYAERALRAGARGYIMKQEATEKILTALRQILGGEIYVSDRMRSTILQRIIDNRGDMNVSPVAGLSDRELEVLRLMGRGYSTGEIASELHRSVKTVEAHRANIKEKLGLKTGVELMRFAVQWIEQEG